MRPWSVIPYSSAHAEQLTALVAEGRRARAERCPLAFHVADFASQSHGGVDGALDGAVALSDGHLGGYMLAARVEDPVWGASVVSRVDNWGVVAGLDVSTLAALYGMAFAPKTRGAPQHTLYCAAFDTTMLNAWFQLGFGMEQAYAVARLEAIDTGGPEAEGVTLRLARTGDEDTLASFSALIASTQAGAPVWAGAPADYLAGLRDGFAALANDDSAIVLLAFRGKKPVGYQAWYPMDASASGAPIRRIELSVGATLPEERRSGVGRALTAHGVSEALERGFETCFTDWRTTNPLASSFWLARGFEPYLYRLVRRFRDYAI